MKVSSIKAAEYQRTPSYKGFTRAVFKTSATGTSLGVTHHMNNSWMYRPNAYLCLKHYDFFSKALPGEEKVNVYIYGCSLGYDVHGWNLWLLSGYEKHPEKFWPIIAKDYDKHIIDAAIAGMLPLNGAEIRDINNVIKENNFGDFFTLVNKIDDKWKMPDVCCSGDIYKPSKLLTDKVQFSVADIRDDYVNIEPYRSIVVATNLWPYIEKEDRYLLAENLYKQLDKGSYIKIGENFDNNRICLRDSKSTAELLSYVGFKETEEFRNIFKK